MQRNIRAIIFKKSYIIIASIEMKKESIDQ